MINKIMQQDKENTGQPSNVPTKPNEAGTIHIMDVLRIKDPETHEVFVEMRG